MTGKGGRRQRIHWNGLSKRRIKEEEMNRMKDRRKREKVGNLRLGIAAIRGQMDAEARTAAARRFNDPNSGCQVLLTCTHTLPLG